VTALDVHGRTGGTTGPIPIAYIVSMASGLHSFVFREIRELYGLGFAVRIFPTKVAAGPYMPLAGWPVDRPTPSGFVRGHARMILGRFPEYMRSLRQALRFRALADFAFAGFFAAQVERFGVELVHCHFGDHKLFIGYFVGRLSGRPVTVTIHAYELYDNPNPRLFARALEAAAAIVTVAEHNRGVLAERWNVPRERVAVIRLFADLPSGSNGGPSTRRSKTVLTVARFVEKKGHRTLFRALADLPHDWEAWLIGDGPLDIRGLAASLGVADRVRVLGRVTDRDLQEAYRTATVFCLPSERSETGDQEGVPVALMEAMAHGLPVVATRHAGIPELVEETLVEEGDATGLARALQRIGEDPALAARQGRRNREIIESRFSRRNVFQLKQLFEGLVNDPR